PELAQLSTPDRARTQTPREALRAPPSPSPSRLAPIAAAPSLPEPPPELRMLESPARAPALAARERRPAPVVAGAALRAPLSAAPALPDVPPAPELRTLGNPERSAPRVARERVPSTAPTQTARALQQALPTAPSLPDVPPAPELRTLDAPARALATTARDATPLPTNGRLAEGLAQRLPDRIAPLPADALGRELPAARAEASTSATASTAPTDSLRGDTPQAATPGPLAAPGSPDAGAQVGHDVATAPSAQASDPPRPLNLALPRPLGPTARRTTGLLEVLPAVPEAKSKLEKSVEEAAREDCRKAHADKGLIGAAFLAVDTARGKGCKW
ncbi:MAG: hypothetical protein O9335_12790, partial [Inhella sp.]|nr:hypothetical protein [Inhella sp.]